MIFHFHTIYRTEKCQELVKLMTSAKIMYRNKTWLFGETPKFLLSITSLYLVFPSHVDRKNEV